LWMLNFLVITAAGHAADFKQSKVTEVVNDVQIISAADQAQKAATVNDVFTIPDVLRTGPASRAELVAKDETVTRVGANTIFSFDPASRTIDLQQGSLLFHSHHGNGGGSIHTGSATASVLGSTLIVCATPNGGFKVICLEDEAQIKLPNGLKQQLSPGQMTYILPGGNKLAPVILFRLDDLVLHSLLVKGFIHPLPSMPLILHEVDQQSKLIKSGKATDTGLLAGNNATPNQVEVIDPNTIQQEVVPQKQATGNSSAAKIALKANASLDGSSLTDPAIPTPPDRIFLDRAFTLEDNKFFAGQSFRGFAANDIFINLSGANLEALTLDLTPYASAPEFDLVASRNFNIQRSITFNGLASKSSLYLIAGNQITFSPNITLQANVADFEISSPGILSLDGLTIINNVGDAGFTSGSTVNFHNVNVENTLHMRLTAPNAINFAFDGGGNIGPPGDNSLTTDAKKGSVNISSKSGSLTVTDTSIQAHFLTLNSGDSILLDAKGRTLKASGPGSTANFAAPNLVTVNNADFSSYEVVNMAANTITLNDVTFGSKSIDNFETMKGFVNVNDTQIPGGLNIYNSHYGSTAITSVNQINLSSGPGSTPGIYSFPHP
jgi:hypothetical protein